MMKSNGTIACRQVVLMSGTAPDEMDVSRLAIVVVVVRPSHGKARREMTTKKTLFVTHLHREQRQEKNKAKSKRLLVVDKRIVARARNRKACHRIEC